MSAHNMIYASRFRSWLPRWLSNGWFLVHVFLTYILASWAFTLALPDKTFGTALSYDRFQSINPSENQWAAIFAVGAVIGAWGCWNARPSLAYSLRTTAYRLISSIVLMGYHGLIALFTWEGNHAGTGTPVYIGCTVMAYLLTLWELDRIA